MARKTKAPVDYQTGTPQVGDGVIWNGQEWVAVKLHLWEVLNGKMYQKNNAAVVFGKDSESVEPAIEPRGDLNKDIGSAIMRFRDFYINKVITYGEINLKAGATTKWTVEVDGDDLVFKAAGVTRLKMLSNGDMEFFK